ncbi:MAG TPA: alpha-amylase family glycosyl hydrolase [Candidatus Limnocylindria bacterium]
MDPALHRWWQTAVVYEIYPRSFADADGDGVGDLLGIIGRLDYLAWLGVDAIWITPFYRSPMVDFGYDVADYRSVDPVFGSLEQFDRLLAEAHARGLRVLIDYVPNHTSDQHPWFMESRSARDSAKRDWYVWRDPSPDGGPPNRWLSMFGSASWTLDPGTGQFYLHSFLPQQPDLNWRNPEVRAAMFDVARWWLDRGVDGFRIDAAPMIMKDPQFRDPGDAPPPANLRSLGSWISYFDGYSHAHPDQHELYRSFRSLLDAYPDDRVAIGELHHPDFDVWAQYYGELLDEIHVPFNFHLAYADWRSDAVRGAVEGVQRALPAGAWASWVLGNHDIPRFASPTRAGPSQAKAGMLLLLTLRGTPTIYYGDEIGMRDVAVDTTHARDPVGRDPQRTPMQWDSSPNAGFTQLGVQPWLPIPPDAAALNVAKQERDPDSLLSFVRRLIQLRHDDPVLRVGDYEAFGETPDGTFAFTRTDGTRRLVVLLNLTDRDRTVPGVGPGVVLIGTDRRSAGASVGSAARLAPNEGLVVETDPPSKR